MSEACPTCGSTDRDTLNEPCTRPDVDYRHIPADEFADDWHDANEGSEG